MDNTIDISQLKSGANPPAPKNTEGKNIDGKDLRDFGDGLKEFDPSANGFKPEEIKCGKTDKEKALEACDAMFTKREHEMEVYNELLEVNGGQVTEEELREALGQQQITKWLQDGKGQKFEDEDNTPSQTTHVIDDQPDPAKNTKPTSDLDDLERELEEDYDLSEEQISQTNKPEPIQPVASTMAPNAQDKVVMINPDTDKSPARTVEAKPTTTVTSGEIKLVHRKTPEDASQEDKDLAALDDDIDTPPVDDFEEKLKAELAKKLKPVAKQYDLAHMTVSDKPISVSNAITNIGNTVKYFKWPLIHSGRPVNMKSFTAKELNDLATLANNNSSSSDVFKTMWEHLVNGKGQDFLTWAKCTSYYDVNHLWFAIYGACFSESNYIPYSCAECNNVMVSSGIPLNSMVKFDSEEVKQKFDEVMNMPVEPTMGNVRAAFRTQVSDTLVASFTQPSIYDAVIMPNTFDREFREKYNDIISLMTFLKELYIIRDFGNGPVLSKIAIREYNNEVKQAKAKVIQYAKIIRSLPSDQYNIILAFITSMNETDDMNYQSPAVSCEHCGKEIPAETQSAYDLVFLRHRLALLGV